MTVPPADVDVGVSPARTLTLGDPAPASGLADRLFASAAAVCGPRTLAVVLSGRLRDGMQGARAVAAHGGRVLAQDPAGAEQGSMPFNAMATGLRRPRVGPSSSRGRADRAGERSGRGGVLRRARPIVGDGVNRILAALPPDERVALERRLRPVRHEVRDTVYVQGERIPTVVFPLSGVFSLVVEAGGAAPVEMRPWAGRGSSGCRCSCRRRSPERTWPSPRSRAMR